MIVQLHKQEKKLPYLLKGLIAQKDVNNLAEFETWFRETLKDVTLGDNEQFVICDENSEYFFKPVPEVF